MSRNIWAHEDPNEEVTTALHSTTTTFDAAGNMEIDGTALRSRAAGAAAAETGGVGLGAGGLGAGGFGTGAAGAGAGGGAGGAVGGTVGSL